MATFANPNVLFVVIWVLVLALYSTNCLIIYEGLKDKAILLIVLNVLVSVVLLLMAQVTIKRSCLTIKYRHSHMALRTKYKKFLTSKLHIIRAYIRGLLIIYIFIAILDIFYSNGVPLVWSLSGDSRSYVDFGIPTLHGVANSIVFFSGIFFSIFNPT